MLYVVLVVKMIMNIVFFILEYVRLIFLMEKLFGLIVKLFKIFYYNIDMLYCDIVENIKIFKLKICLIVKLKFIFNVFK